SGEGADGIPARSHAERHRHPRGAGLLEVAAIQGPAPDRSLLLSRAAEPAGSAALSRLAHLRASNSLPQRSPHLLGRRPIEIRDHDDVVAALEIAFHHRIEPGAPPAIPIIPAAGALAILPA